MLFRSTANLHWEAAVVYWIEDSPAMTEPLALAMKTAASAQTPVLILSEPGNGASAVAKLIHAHSTPPLPGPLVAVRCGGAPEAALQSELFGHPSSSGDAAGERADDRTAPAVARARGGTLFIDEIALLGLPAQAALAALSDRRHQGATEAGFRLIAATSVDLRQRVGCRLFRQDLLELLGVIQIPLPPLRERPDELMALAEKFIAAHARETGAPALSPEARDKLLRHRFPGNADELRAVIERALILERSGVLSADSISFAPPPIGVGDAASDFVNLRINQAIIERKRPPTLDEIERDYLVWLLREAGGNRTVVARQMGVSYPTVMKKIADYKIDIKSFRRGDAARPAARRN